MLCLEVVEALLCTGVLLVAAVTVLGGTSTAIMVSTTILTIVLNASFVERRVILFRCASSVLIAPSLVKTSASLAVMSYDVDTNWHADSTATDHITG
jgi:hypothetical protein